MRRVTFSLALLLASTACGDSNAPLEHEDTHSSADTQTEAAEDTMPPEEVEPVDAGPAPLTAWPDSVRQFPFLDDQTLSGDIADGAAVEMGWADEPTVACWTILHQDKFLGHQVYFALDRALQKSSQLTITLTPTAGVDLNLYAVAQPIDTYLFPPDIPSASGCVSSYESDAGGEETIRLQNLNQPLMWLIAVSGPEGTTSGAFELQIERSDLRSGF